MATKIVRVAAFGFFAVVMGSFLWSLNHQTVNSSFSPESAKPAATTIKSFPPLPTKQTVATCDALKSQRQFLYRDQECGRLDFHIKDLNEAFAVEQEFWREAGVTDPWYAVDTQLPHGARPPMSLKLKFYTSGMEWVSEMQNLLIQPRALGVNWGPKGTALDLGCGLGRMSHALAAIGYDKVLCVDQAMSFLEGAERSLHEVAAARKGVVHSDAVSKLKFVHSGPDLLCKVAAGSVDFVHSVITLQHMKPMLQVAYIEQLCDLLNIGGTGYFQIPILIFKQNKDVHCTIHQETKAMMMHYTPEKEVIDHLQARGCKVLLAEEKDRVGPVGKSMHFAFIKEAIRGKNDHFVPNDSPEDRGAGPAPEPRGTARSREFEFALPVPEDVASSGSALSTKQAEPTCSALKAQRQFAYRDNECGLLEFHVRDLNAAFKIEQAYWKEQGESDPWYAVDTQLPHGASPPMSLKLQFYTSGIDWVSEMQNLLIQPRALGPNWWPKGTALDLGCGLGRMSHALAVMGFSKVLCVDQAKSFLEGAERSLGECAAEGKSVGFSAISKIEYMHSGPDLLCKVDAGSVDFVHSVITLQHMKPMLQVAYIEQLCDLLNVGGTGYFQIPTKIFKQSNDVHCIIQQEHSAMMMHYTPEKEVRHHLQARGCKVLLAEEKDRVGPIGESMHFVFIKEGKRGIEDGFKNSVSALQAGVTAPKPSALAGATENVCASMDYRTFTYRDSQCGHLVLRLKDLNEAFKVEQDFWAEAGATDPWYAVDTQLPHGDDPPLELKLTFYRSGVEWATDMQTVLRLPGALGPGWVAAGIALDLGCGLGRMSHGLAVLGFEQVLCVDQAQTMLDGAGKGLEECAREGAGRGNVVTTKTASRLKYLQSGPNLLCKVAPASVDFVHSVITLQHMKPQLQVAYIEQLCDTLRVGGTGYFQIPTKIFDQGSDPHCNFHSEQRAMMMHFTPEAEVKRHLQEHKCRVLLAEEKDRVGPVGESMHFVFRKEE